MITQFVPDIISLTFYMEFSCGSINDCNPNHIVTCQAHHVLVKKANQMCSSFLSNFFVQVVIQLVYCQVFKDPWPRVLSLPERFVGNPVLLAHDNIYLNLQQTMLILANYDSIGFLQTMECPLQQSIGRMWISTLTKYLLSIIN